jgi:hypothetical protein
MNLNAAAERIRADGTKSAATKTAAIARAYAEAKSQMADLEAKSASDARMATRRAMRTAFGSTSSDPATFALQRSAMNEVEKIDPSTDRNASRKAADLLDRATSLGDQSLANAVGMAAHKNGWSDVLEQFATTAKPAQVEAINELRRPQEFNAVAMLRYVVPAPSELGSFPSDTTVQRMIDADPVQVGGR